MARLERLRVAAGCRWPNRSVTNRCRGAGLVCALCVQTADSNQHHTRGWLGLSSDAFGACGGGHAGGVQPTRPLDQAWENTTRHVGAGEATTIGSLVSNESQLFCQARASELVRECKPLARFPIAFVCVSPFLFACGCCPSNRVHHRETCVCGHNRMKLAAVCSL